MPERRPLEFEVSIDGQQVPAKHAPGNACDDVNALSVLSLWLPVMILSFRDIIMEHEIIVPLQQCLLG